MDTRVSRRNPEGNGPLDGRSGRTSVGGKPGNEDTQKASCVYRPRALAFVNRYFVVK